MNRHGDGRPARTVWYPTTRERRTRVKKSPRRSVELAIQAVQQTGHIISQLGWTALHRSWAERHQQRTGGEPGSGFLEDGADPSPETVAHHGRSNLPGDGKSDPRPGLDIGRSR